jgi:hypothetical protein
MQRARFPSPLVGEGAERTSVSDLAYPTSRWSAFRFP